MGDEDFAHDELERDHDEAYEPDYDDGVDDPNYEVSGCDDVDDEEYIDREYGDGMTDAEADADVLASAGWGTDEDYGDYGDYY